MSTMLTDILEKSLVVRVACGRSVRSWAKRHGVDVATACERSLENGFRKLVDITRLRVADRMVGKLTSGATFAIDQLIWLCRKSKSDTVRLSASRALLAHWLSVSRIFDTKSKIKELNEWMDRIEEKNPAGQWQPTSPFLKGLKLP